MRVGLSAESYEIAIATSYFPHESLPGPMDRNIAVTARAEDIPLVTAEERIRNYAVVTTIW